MTEKEKYVFMKQMCYWLIALSAIIIFVSLINEPEQRKDIEIILIDGVEYIEYTKYNSSGQIVGGNIIKK